MAQASGFLHSQELQFLTFGGKGGVGKTTAAVASALYLASKRPKQSILIISTDPAHSLGDSLSQEIGDKITLVKGAENLFALEIDAPKRLEEFKAKYLEALGLGIHEVPLFPHQIVGVEALREIAKTLYGNKEDNSYFHRPEEAGLAGFRLGY